MGKFRHYTCDHAVLGIRRGGLVLPKPHPVFGFTVSWWTDLTVPDRWALGLTSEWIGCDRTTYAFEAVDDAGIQPWWRFRRTLTRNAEALEHGVVRPRHWFVAVDPVSVVEIGGSL